VTDKAKIQEKAFNLVAFTRFPRPNTLKIVIKKHKDSNLSYSIECA
jgi:hypothetical protein